MSTRSGKRIHNSSLENNEKDGAEVLPKSERKTRNKRFKENDDNLDVTLPKAKKRQNYVSYPGGNIQVSEIAPNEALETKVTRKTKKNTLKEHNANVPALDSVGDNNEGMKASRVTRQTKKFTENVEEQNAESQHLLEKEVDKKGKKNKKKKSKNSDINENVEAIVDNGEFNVKSLSKKSKKKKKGKKSNDSQEEVLEKQILNGSNLSIDSFHSAAGSLTQNSDIKIPQMDTSLDKNSQKHELSHDETDSKRVRKTSLKNAFLEKPSLKHTVEQIETFEHESKKRRKSIGKNTSGNVSTLILDDLNSTYDKTDTVKDNQTFSSEKPKARRSLRLNPSDNEMECGPESYTKKLNSTLDNVEIMEQCDPKPICHKEPKTRSWRSNQTVTAKVESADKSNKLNTTFEKSPKTKTDVTEDSNNATLEKTNDELRPISLNSTFDKSSPKLNTTFDKDGSENSSGKNSLISSDSDKNSLISSDDGNLNATYDKDSRISITSDESKIENIVNLTPVLIESSMDESCISTKDLNNTTQKESSPNSSIKENIPAPDTPLKREGTFTKESPEVKATNATPTKKLSLPSPGCTPFHTSRTSQKSVLNVTRSIEKSTRRSSLAEVVPRQTKVMFCSPKNNPLVVNQQKRKVIKSSLKGSNKSFVFEDSGASIVKPVCRKRSFTASEAEETRAKRKRLAHSVDRLSRPRTSSATAKLPDTTPSKKAPTPSKPRSDMKRTKLPNFAALHQREFAKMESLDECQSRRARRARQLLTPTGAVTVLERSSPKVPEPAKPKESTKKMEKPTTPAKLTKLPTLESLRQGYTRFGFKMNCDVNPFSISSKNDKPKEKLQKTNRLNKNTTLPPKTPVPPTSEKLRRQPTLPSLDGATSRKEAAKQTVMREKSFTSLSNKRDLKRNESRTVIKGVRTNRRFELQMKMRKID